jgi:hypothetical protein
MTAFPFRFRLFWAVPSLSLLLLTLVLLLPTEAVSVPLSPTGGSRPRVAADEQRTVEIRNPRGSTPLAPSEIDHGRQIADLSDHVKRARASAAGSARLGRLAAGSPRLRPSLENVQPLFTQRHIEDKNAPDSGSRKADVLYYDYSTNEVIEVVVDLNRNAVQETRVTRGVTEQPPPSSVEIKTALQLIFDHPQLGPRLQTAYQEVTGQSLNDVIPLEAKTQGGIFFPDSAARTPLGDATADCAQDRCIQLFIPIDDTKFIDTTNLVVDLTTLQILWVDEGLTGHNH